ncbi:NAD-dependent epimerase/dehydratase family protein [Nitrosomonas aestuarii]|uniref:NAD-dependent epimerase/dehydratase family protein n=1 Tax=Nitrosomonas aestuarii TaxID=52441 RepID=UPI000D3049FE|nr:NAD(P)-dependent oxidoreductase [Nitrosomonas aestuarii]PTN12213.1 nucleoside-diphosphate-sugar epimerase [Nitrosomonas aestuarii]
MQKLVAVTGATGFIGHRLISKLASDGWTIKALTRKKKENTNAIQWINGDLGNLSALADLTQDISAIVHCAGAVRGRSFDEFVHTNVDGTQNLLHIATERNQRPRFLFISSLAARQPDLSWYAQSKHLAEQQIINHSTDLPWTIFRPTAVYGPGDEELKPLFKATRRGLLPVVGKPNNRFGLIHVDDLVAAIQIWLNTEAPCNDIFELDDGMPNGYSFESLASLAQEVWKKPVRCIKIPHSFIKNVAILNLWLARIFNYSPMLTPGKVKELQHSDWVCDNTPLMHALPGWKPRVHLHESLPLII